MKKIICLLLCLVMVLSSVALLASCKDKEEDPTEGEAIELSEATQSVDLSQYTVIYARSVSDSFKGRVMDFATDISDAIGKSIRAKNDSGDASNGNYEIIVGDSARNESNQALSEIKGDGWAIRVVPNMNKVIIIGKTEFLTTVAMDYFVVNYLNNDALSGTTTIMHEKATANEIKMMNLVDTSIEDKNYKAFSVIYNNRLDDVDGSKNGDKSREYGDTNNTGHDRPYDVAKNVKSGIVSLSRAPQASIPLKRDNEEAETECEVLVGNVDRPESQEALAELGVNQYSLIIRNNKMILGAHNDTTLLSAYELFDSMVAMSTVTDPATGAKMIKVPAEYSRVETIDKDNWVTDFPRPDTTTLLTSMDVGNDALVQVFIGEGVSREGFVAYCDKLEAEGYSVISAETQMSDSSFVTYMNSRKGYILHVSHAAHKYAGSEGVDEFVEAIRVVSASTKTVTVDQSLFNPDRTWIKRTNTMITQYEANRLVGGWGNQFVITLEDGSFVVFDGGVRDAGKGATKDEDRLFKVLEDLHIKVHGEEPSAQNPIRIKAWLLSHEHSDHFGVFQLFCKAYGPRADVVVERLLYNFSSDDENYNTGNPETFVRANLEELQNKADHFKAIKVHTGEKYYIANAEFHILYTHEDIYPQRAEFFNSTSTVFRISLGTTPEAKKGQEVSAANIAQTETLILLGDLERVGSLCLRSMYSTDIESTMVQVAHHGYNGCEEKLYKNINPITVWWPTQNTQFLGQTRASYKTSTNWTNAANYGVAHECPRVKMIIVHGDYNTTLTLTVNGPDFENLYDAYQHRQIVVDVDPAPGEGAGNVIYRPNGTTVG